MKVANIGRILGDKGWDAYSLATLDEQEIIEARPDGESNFIADWLAERSESWAPPAMGSVCASAYAVPHPAMAHTFIVTVEVRLVRAPSASA